jgi:hypothetical protein
LRRLLVTSKAVELALFVSSHDRSSFEPETIACNLSGLRRSYTRNR